MNQEKFAKALGEFAATTPFAHDDVVDSCGILEKCRVSARPRSVVAMVCAAAVFCVCLVWWPIGLLAVYGTFADVPGAPWYWHLGLTAPAALWFAVRDFYRARGSA